MMSRKGGMNSSNDHINDPLNKDKGKGIAQCSSHDMDQLIGGVSAIDMDPEQDGGWELCGKKSKKKTGSASKQWGPLPSQIRVHQEVKQTGIRSPGGSKRVSSQTQKAPSPDSRKHSGRGYVKPQSSNQGLDPDYTVPAVIPPPLKNGWVWSGRTASLQTLEHSSGHEENADTVYTADAPISNDDNVDDTDTESDVNYTDDDLMSDEELDSWGSQENHDNLKRNKWFKPLFERLDKLKVEEITDPAREWHCPACKGGPGAIDWYRGLQPLVTHAKTVRSKRVNLHRVLAEALEEELRQRGTTAVPAGNFGKWRGPGDSVDKEIVWPPMVIIMNTLLDKDDNDKWLGMGNQELLDCFGSYSVVKARHSYGPQGHRGMSILLFESSAIGYMEAERLNRHFEETGCDRISWTRNKLPFYPGGKRQLYGFIAEKQDIESFNKHSQGKSKLKYEMKSYQEMVVNQMKQMSEDNQQLIWFKDRYVSAKQSNKALQESLALVSEKFRKNEEEKHIVKLRTKTYHEQTREEIDFIENFYRDTQKFYDSRNAKEENFEKIQQDRRDKVARSEGNLISDEEGLSREEKIAKFNKLQDIDLEEFKRKRDELTKKHEEEMAKLHEEERQVLLRKFQEEEKFNLEFNMLLDEYTLK